MIRHACLALLLAACATTQTPRPGARQTVAHVTLASPTPLTGNLVVYWLAPGQLRRDAHSPSGYWLGGFSAVTSLLANARAYPAITLGAGREQLVYLDVPAAAPADALVFAHFDVHGRTFDMVLDDAQQGDAVAPAQPVAARVALVLARVPPQPARRETCSGDRDRLELIPAPEVAGTIGNSTTRRICVHLPKGYEAEPTRRFPVVYVLPGLSGVDSGGSIGRVFAAADEAAPEGAAIFVGVNIQTKAGASYLVDSPLTGNFDRFLAETVPAFIEQKYRTLPRRALIGQSTGGFGVVSFALRHSDRFGVVAASAPDGLDFASWIAPDGKHLLPFVADLLRFEDAIGPPGQMASYAADWTPDPKARWGFRWAADPKTGEIRPDIFARWVAHSPSELLNDPTIRARAQQHLAGNILLTVGTADDFGLFAPTERFARQLTAAKIANVFLPDDGDHAGTPARKRAMVDFVLAHLAAPAHP